MHMDSVPEAVVRNWLLNIADFTSELHVVRLVYSHPLGATRYISALDSWFDRAHALATEQHFRWYTMSQIGDFLNSREEVNWELEDQNGHLFMKASHPKSLEHQAWMFPDDRYSEPRVTEGRADIHDQDGYWIVAAQNCKQLKLRLNARQAGDTNPQATN